MRVAGPEWFNGGAIPPPASVFVKKYSIGVERMGYYVDIFEYNLKARAGVSEEEVEDVLESLEVLSIVYTGGELVFEEESDIKYTSEVTDDLKRLAKIADGYVVLLGEDRSLGGYILENGRAVEAIVKLNLVPWEKSKDNC